MNKVSADKHRGQYDYLKTVSTSFTVFIALAGLTWIVWQASSSNHRAEIKSLQQTLVTVTDGYNALAVKSTGLSEPRLFKSDTFAMGANHQFYMHAGRVQLTYVYGNNNGVRFSLDNGIDSVKYSNLKVTYQERYEFTVSEQPFYMAFFVHPEIDTQVIWQVFELKPLYVPFGSPTSVAPDSENVAP